MISSGTAVTSAARYYGCQFERFSGLTKDSGEELIPGTGDVMLPLDLNFIDRVRSLKQFFLIILIANLKFMN